MDVHIRGERVFPLCEVLAAQGVPFVLTSGYADWQMPENGTAGRGSRSPTRSTRWKRRWRIVQRLTSHAEREPEISDVVAGVGAAADEAVLVHVARFAGQVLVSGVEMVMRLRTRSSPVRRWNGVVLRLKKGSLLKVERGLAGDRQRIFEIGPDAPAGTVDMLPPALLEAKPAVELSAANLGEAIERHLLAGAMLHDGEVAGGILRVVRVAGPDRHDLVEAVAEQGVGLDFVKAVAIVAEAERAFLRQAPAVAELHRRVEVRPQLLIRLAEAGVAMKPIMPPASSAAKNFDFILVFPLFRTVIP